MKTTLNIDVNEVKRYAGLKGASDDKLDSLVLRAINEVLDTVEPRYVYKVLSVKTNGDTVDAGGLIMKSKDLSKLLKDKESTVLICTTLGYEIDRKISAYSLTEPAYAICLDAAATAAIEQVTDNAQKEIFGDGGEKLGRFSAGYGDLDISYQADIVRVLNASKLIGVSVMRSYLLTPMKSVTAFVDVKCHSCEDCKLKDCIARK